MATISKPQIAPDILDKLQAKVVEEKQVIVHCCFQNDFTVGNLIRIWPSTVLLDKDSSHESKLLFANNVVYHPLWLEVPPVKEYWFTLIFSGLPSACTLFDFAEIIPESGGFYVPSIPRNQTDIYSITL